MKHPGVRAALKLDAEDEAKGSQNSEVVPIAWKIGALSEGLHLKKKTVRLKYRLALPFIDVVAPSALFRLTAVISV